MSEHVRNISDDTLDQEVLKAKGTVLLYFWSTSCAPCRTLAPVVDQVAENYADRIKVTKINIAENAEAPQKLNVRATPTLMIFKDGELKVTKMGAPSKAQLTAFIDANI